MEIRITRTTMMIVLLLFIFTSFSHHHRTQALRFHNLSRIASLAIIRLTALKLTTYQPFCSFTTPQCKPIMPRCNSPVYPVILSKSFLFIFVNANGGGELRFARCGQNVNSTSLLGTHYLLDSEFRC
jgi:hypothetical protein